MSAFTLKLLTAATTVVSGGNITFVLCNASSQAEAVLSQDTKLSSIQCAVAGCASDPTGTHRGDVRCHYSLFELTTPAGPLPAGFLVTDAILTLTLSELANCSGVHQPGTITPVRDGSASGFGSGTSCGGTACIFWDITDVSNVLAFLTSSFGIRVGNINGGGLQRTHINRITVSGNYSLWSTLLSLSPASAIEGDIITVTDGNNGLLALSTFTMDELQSGGASVSPTVLSHTAGQLQLIVPAGLAYARIGVFGDGIFLGQFVLYSALDLSGLYLASPSTADQYYDRSTVTPTTVAVKIPNPYAKTAFLDEESYE